MNTDHELTDAELGDSIEARLAALEITDDQKAAVRAILGRLLTADVAGLRLDGAIPDDVLTARQEINGTVKGRREQWRSVMMLVNMTLARRPDLTGEGSAMIPFGPARWAAGAVTVQGSIGRTQYDTVTRLYREWHPRFDDGPQAAEVAA